MTRAVRTGACTAGALLVTALSGCVVTPGSGLSAIEARSALYDSLDDTQQVLGGEWDNRDDPTARGCLIPLWVEGQHFPGLRLGSPPEDVEDAVSSVSDGSPPEDVEDAVSSVSDAWLEWGYRVEQTLVGEVVELQGRDSVGELLIFRVTRDAMTLQGESECRPK